MARKSKSVIAAELLASQQVVEEGPSLLSGLVENLLEVEPETTEPVKVKQEKNQGVGTMVKQLILEGLSNKDILVKLEEMYGNKNTTYACVAWYRNKMKQTGVVVKQQAALSWVQDFAKRTGLSEEAVQELSRKVA